MNPLREGYNFRGAGDVKLYALCVKALELQAVLAGTLSEACEGKHEKTILREVYNAVQICTVPVTTVP